MSISPAWMQSNISAKKRACTLATIILFVVFIFLLPRPDLPDRNKVANKSDMPAANMAHTDTSVEVESSPREQAANATLGFEKILALSTGPSWRTRGLLSAAEYTGLHIEIPTQPHNGQEVVEAFEKLGTGRAGVRSPKQGSALAWLAHLDLIKLVIGNGWESAFVMEDDADWDTRLFDQMRMISDNVRLFVGADVSDQRPFGGGWDVLWLGHCGEISDEKSTRLIEYEDDTRPTIDQYGGWSKKMLREWVPEGIRVVQEAKQPVCTFGYGFTRESAQKILHFLSQGSDEAFDVALQHHCTEGHLKCISINPEIIHHYEPDREHGYVSQVKEADGQGQSADESEYEHVKGSTSNILYSARCKAVFNDTCLAAPWEIDN